MRPTSIASLRSKLIEAASEFAGDNTYETKRQLAARRQIDEAERIRRRHTTRWAQVSQVAYERMVPGRDIDLTAINPRLVLCQTAEDYAIHRFHSAASGFPTRDRPGRRMKLLLIDLGHAKNPIMAVATLSSAVSVLPARDQWIGWTTAKASNRRWDRLAYVLDLSTCIGVEPYACLTSGKLLAHLVLSRECQELYRSRYENKPTERTGRIIDSYALIVGTGAFKSRTPAYRGFQHQNGQERFIRVGMTKGYSSAHISDELYQQLMVHFGEGGCYGLRRRGPHVRFHNLRVFARLLGIDEELLVRPGQKRSVYLAPTALNSREFLLGQSERLQPRRPWARSLTASWEQRWLRERLNKPNVLSAMRRWNPEQNVLNCVA